MTSLRTMEEAKEITRRYGTLSMLSDIGGNAHSKKLCQKLVLSSAYRTQCLHHAAVLGIKNVLFIVGKGGKASPRGINYASLLQFKETFRHYYK